MTVTSESQADREQRRVAYLLGTAVERLVRVRQVLNRQHTFVQIEQKKPQYGGVIDPFFDVLTKQEEILTRNQGRIASYLRKKPLDENEQEALRGILQQVINVVSTLHELLILLPRESVEPQLFLFLKDCFAAEWKVTSVITTNQLSAYEYRVDDVLARLEDIGQHEVKQWRQLLKGLTRAGSVLAQAFVDRGNPLAWAVLAHEYGHAIDEPRQISKKILYGDSRGEGNPPQRDPKLKWVSEIFADLVAARVLGPASQVPILFVEMSHPLLKASEEAPDHPPTTVRLKLVREYVRELGVGEEGFEEVFDTYSFDYAQKLSQASKDEKSLRNSLEEAVETFLRAHMDRIVSEVNSLELRVFGMEQIAHARTLKLKLQSDLPIASLRSSPNEEIQKKLNSFDEMKPTRERVYEVLSDLNEVPASSSEILTAGWLYMLETFQKRLKDTFPGTSTMIDLNEYAKYLNRTDELLLMSIERASVHNSMIHR